MGTVVKRGERRCASGGCTSLAAAMGTVVMLAVGCSVDVHDGLGPRVPVPDVEGTVLRTGAPAIHVDVELHNVASGLQVFETESNLQGFYGFAGVPAGLWEVRVESDAAGDFESVRRQFYRADGDGRYQLLPFEVFAFGAELEAPPTGATVPVPTPFTPLVMRWTFPSRPGVVARAQVYDHLDRDVWKSAWITADSIRWYGYGSEGSYQNVPVGSGSYEWRVKFAFPDTTEARTARRSIRFE